ncbi:MAG: leucine--tRNA ligase, partial [Bacteroidetes bacterium]|nr:leucine--tRNA ligase [Bacteroidota bacterium]
MDYNFRDIELKWQKNWKESSIYKIEIDNSKPKFYILDMFPYPSGSGLHVGHPLGYIATDIYGRYKRQKGYNVLHPMGFDAFGLPAEQWAITTGRHPADTTDENIKRYKEQLELIGLGYDWSREIRTSDPKFYKWTQWIFIKLFHSWFDNNANKARPIESLIEAFEKDGNITINAAVEKDSEEFTSNEWKTKDYKAQQKILSSYRLAYLAFAEVNWCPELGTVLANEEVQTDPVKGLVSERGGYPVERKPMNQWFLRITAYSERLITEMDEVDFPDSIREMQKNWIGRSDGAMIDFAIKGSNKIIPVFTTRPDTIYGATYMVLAPEHELVQEVLAEERRDKVEKYIQYTSTRSEKDRMAEIKNITGEFTGGYAINPFTKEEIPIWVAEYVLAGYGSGAIMAVPAHDTRDHAFAKHFELEIRPVVEGGNIEEEALEDKSGKHINSDIINGMEVDQATQTIIDKVVEMGIGEHQVNYKLRDFLFSRQRYWGEPFPIVYKKGIPETVPLEDLPVLLPNMYDFQPTGTGEAPLAKESDWVDLPDGKTRETNTMPGWAGSNWYFIRYLDPHNEKEIISGEVEGYWKNVDLYVGGAEHATGHLIYSRFIYKFLSDLGIVSEKEPYKKLINQGMILGYSHYINVSWDEKIAYSANITKDEEKDVKGLVKFRIPIEYVDIDGNFDLDKLEDFKKEFPEFDTVEFKDKGGVFHIAEKSMDKMSKSLRNVVNPDEIIEEFGADTFRMYEMFLG